MKFLFKLPIFLDHADEGARGKLNVKNVWENQTLTILPCKNNRWIGIPGDRRSNYHERISSDIIHINEPRALFELINVDGAHSKLFIGEYPPCITSIFVHGPEPTVYLYQPAQAYLALPSNRTFVIRNADKNIKLSQQFPR